jgi:hypothetical protein
MNEIRETVGAGGEIDIARFIAQTRQQVVTKPGALGFRIARKPGHAWVNALQRARRRRWSSSLDGQVQVDVSLLTLLRLDDSEFVRKAYIKLLGRRPDPSGYTTHLALLRGHQFDRIKVLDILSQSPEGRARSARVRGLRIAILAGRLFSFDANIWDLMRYDGTEFVDVVYSRLLQRQPDPAGYVHRISEAKRGRTGKLAILAELVASAEGRGKRLRIRGLLMARIWNRLTRYDVRLAQIMRYDGIEFVDHVYADLLRREPDPVGYAHRISEATRGRSGKLRILAELVASAEGRSKGLRVRGLLFARIWDRLVRYDVRLEDIIRYDGAEFVSHVYADLLRREPDTAGYAMHLAEAESRGRSGKINVLAGVVGCREGHEKRLKVRGLLFAVLRQKLYETIAGVLRRTRAVALRIWPRGSSPMPDRDLVAGSAVGGNRRLVLRTDGANDQPGRALVETERSEA